MVDYVKPGNLEKIWAATGVKTPTPDASKISSGWVAEIPPSEYFNYIENKQDAFIAHVNQKGGVVWDSTTEYLANVSYAMGSNGILYKCLVNNTNINPVTDVASNWRVAYYFTTEVYTKVENDAKYLVKSNNLADLTNTATARTTLSVYSKAETDAKYTTIANNLSDVNAATARNNLSVYSKAEGDSRYPLKSNNLSDLDAGIVRGNLGVSTTSESNILYVAKSANLADLSSVATARTNISVYSKVESNDRYLAIANNLGDINPSTSRTNLSVYSKAETDAKYLSFTGNLSGLVDPAASFNNIKQPATDSYAGVSQFASAAELLAGTVADKATAPSKLRLGFSATLGINGHIQLPSWLLGVRFEWGRANVISTTPLNVNMGFPNNCYVFIPSLAESPDQADIAVGGYITSNTVATISYFHGGSTDTAPFMWFAIGN